MSNKQGFNTPRVPRRGSPQVDTGIPTTARNSQPTNNGFAGKLIGAAAGYAGKKIMEHGAPIVRERINKAVRNADKKVGEAIEFIAGYEPKNETKTVPIPVTISTTPMGPSKETASRTRSGGKSGGDKMDINIADNLSSNLGFTVPNTVDTPIVIRTPLETALYENPLVKQSTVTDNQTNYSRTNMRCINFALATGNEVDDIWRNMFNAYYQEILSNTNGGSAVVTNNFTQQYFKSYCQSTWKLYAHTMELMSIMAWNTTDPVPNKILRRMAARTSGLTDLLSLRNRMLSTLSTYVLPLPMIRYGQWLTQTYKMNPHSYSVEVKLVSEDMMKFLVTDGYSTYIDTINTLISDLTNYTERHGAITALLVNKTSGSWSTLAKFALPCNRSFFDPAFNDIFNNLAIMTPSWDYTNAYYTPQITSDLTQSVPGCFETAIGSLPYHVIETFCDRYTGYNPLFFGAGNFPTVTGYTAYKNTSSITFYEDDSLARGYTSAPMNNAKDQIGNYVVKIYRNDTTTPTTLASCDYQLAPRGNQVFLYDVAFKMIKTTKERLAEMMFN